MHFSRPIASPIEPDLEALTSLSPYLQRTATVRSRSNCEETYGAKNRLEVIVESYDPRNVRCGSRSNPGPVRGSCTHIIERMYPGKTVFTFGRKGEEGVTMPLPYRKQSPRKECMMTVNTIGGNDHASWYDLFKATVAVDMICARNSPALNGIITGVGESGELSISLNRESPVVIEAGGRGGDNGTIETA
ncbi:hypothetical protein G7Y79_00030g064910 [Physcia stellaris]|nr:hypothetical protein G7Y79_00030g064910 [Physcia stellaris]